MRIPHNLLSGFAHIGSSRAQLQAGPIEGLLLQPALPPMEKGCHVYSGALFPRQGPYGRGCLKFTLALFSTSHMVRAKDAKFQRS